MKNIFKLGLGLLIVLQLSSCSDDNEKSKRQIKIEMLTATPWGNAKVTHNPDGDLSGQYANFMVAFTDEGSGDFDGTYFISNGGYAFSETTGKWMFNDALDKIILDSGKEMDIQLEENLLQLDFVTALSGGRVTGVSGHFVFDLEAL